MDRVQELSAMTQNELVNWCSHGNDYKEILCHSIFESIQYSSGWEPFSFDIAEHDSVTCNFYQPYEDNHLQLKSPSYGNKTWDVKLLLCNNNEITLLNRCFFSPEIILQSCIVIVLYKIAQSDHSIDFFL